MSFLSHSPSSVTVTSAPCARYALSLSAIDAQAEREAAAIEWLADNVDESVTSRGPIAALAAEALAARFDPNSKSGRASRYPRASSLRAHFRLLSAVQRNDMREISRIIDRARNVTETSEQRAAREARRAAKLAKALVLRQAKDQSLLNVETASRLIGIAPRTLQRAAREGRLHAKRVRIACTWQYRFTPRALGNFALSKTSAA